jgi:hypothetical protein
MRRPITHTPNVCQYIYAQHYLNATDGCQIEPDTNHSHAAWAIWMAIIIVYLIYRAQIA